MPCPGGECAESILCTNEEGGTDYSWAGGLCSVAVLLLVPAPTQTMRFEPVIAGYVFAVAKTLLAIWILCGLVWVTLYKRSRTKEKEPAAKVTKVIETDE